MKITVVCAIFVLELVSSFPYPDAVPGPTYYESYEPQQIQLPNLAHSPDLYQRQLYIDQNDIRRQNYENMLRNQILTRPSYNIQPGLNPAREQYINSVLPQYEAHTPQYYPVQPIRQYQPVQKLPADATAEAHAEAGTPVVQQVNNPYLPQQYNPQLLAYHPRIQQVLASTPLKKRYLVLHPNGTIEHIDKIEHIVEQHPNYILVNAGSVTPKPNEGLKPPQTQIQVPSVSVPPTVANQVNVPARPTEALLPAPFNPAQEPVKPVPAADSAPGPITAPVSVNQLPVPVNQGSVPVNNGTEPVNQVPEPVRQTSESVNQAPVPVNEAPVPVNPGAEPVNQPSGPVNQGAGAPVNQAPAPANPAPVSVNQAPESVDSAPTPVKPNPEPAKTPVPAIPVKPVSPVNSVPKPVNPSGGPVPPILNGTVPGSKPTVQPPTGPTTEGPSVSAPSTQPPILNGTVRDGSTQLPPIAPLNPTTPSSKPVSTEPTSTALPPSVTATATAVYPQPTTPLPPVTPSPVATPTPEAISEPPTEASTQAPDNPTTVAPYIKPSDPKNDLDLLHINNGAKPVVWIRTKDLDFWEKLTNPEDTFDVVYVFNVPRQPKVTKETKTTIHPDGTVVEEITQTICDDDDSPPRVIKTTTITKPDGTQSTT